MEAYRGSDGGSSGTHLCVIGGQRGSDEGGHLTPGVRWGEGHLTPTWEVSGEGRALNFGGSPFGLPRCAKWVNTRGAGFPTPFFLVDTGGQMRGGHLTPG